jgi:CRP-like cAMP-binding protein
MATVGVGDFAGRSRCSSRLRVVRPSRRFFVLTPRDFRQVVAENPSVERKVLRALARRVLELSRDPTLA